MAAPPRAPGAVVSHYRFDALARVVVRVALFWPLNLAADAGCIVPQRTDYFLDGARRIVETQHTPTPAESDWCDAACVSTCTAAWTAAEWRERDYLYGPDGIDEHLLFAQGTNPGYMLLDAGGNVVATIKAGPANLLVPGGLGEQYTFSPYGTLEAKFRTSNTSLPHNRVGHQGLFFDSWEVRPSPEVLHTGQIGAYHNRNRFYAPRLGRFLNRDPNESAQPLLAAMASNAQPLDVLLSAFDLAGQFGDGANLYAYLAANPINRRDPSGLNWWDEDIDDAIGDYAWDLVGVVGQLAQARADLAKGAALAAAYAAASFLWDQLIWDRDEGNLLGLVTGGFFARACFEAGTLVLMEDGTHVPIETVTLGARVRSMSAEPGSKMEGTELDPDRWRLIRLESSDPVHGTVVIELLRPIEWLTAADARIGRDIQLVVPEMDFAGTARVAAIEACPTEFAGPLRGAVTGSFVRSSAATIALSVYPLDEPIGTTSSHPFYSLDRDAWVQAGRLVAGEKLAARGGPTVVLGIEPTQHAVAVYNLEVYETNTYFVSSAELWVHNSCTHGQFVKQLRNKGFSAPGATRSGDGKMYTHADGTRVRIMPRPDRAPFPGEPAEKFAEAYYYRVSGPDGGEWGPHIPLKGD